MGLDMRKPDFVACLQQRHRPACTSMKSDQPLCQLLSEKYSSQTCFMQNFNVLASFCS